jgi:hypothetical protein
MNSKNEKTIGDLANEIKSIKLNSIGRVLRVGWKLMCLMGFLLCGFFILLGLSEVGLKSRYLPIYAGLAVGGIACLVELISGNISKVIFRVISTIK